MKKILFINIFLCLFISNILSIDNEYCSLNLEKNECIEQTNLKTCCWAKIDTTATFEKPYAEGCFDYRYLTRVLKFLINPKSFNTMTDEDLCNKLGMICDHITLKNFVDIFLKSEKLSEITKINKVIDLSCRSF